MRWLTALIRSALDAECVMTTHPGHATQLAAHADQYDGLIAVGGDCTLAEVINGMPLGAKPLGIVPAGTGNGVALHLGLRDVHQALAAIRRGRTASLDVAEAVLRCRDQAIRRYVLSTCSIGYAAESVELANRHFKPMRRLCYPVASYLQRWRQRSFKARVRLDGGDWREVRLTNLMVNNTRYAGNFRVFPQASTSDGELDVLYAATNPVTQLLHNIAILTGTYFYRPGTECLARRIELVLEEPRTAMLDGELVGDVVAMSIEVRPAQLTCYV